MRLSARVRNWWDRTPDKRGLDVGEVFYRLSGSQRFLLVILCAAAYCLFVGGVFTSNVLPHYKAIINADGSINAGEITSSLTLTAGVLGLTSIPLILKLPISLFSKLGIIVTSVFIIASNITNACGTQTRAREARNDAPRQKIERIHRLDAKITGLDAAWRQVPAHEYVTEGQVKSAEKAAEELRKSASDECNTGILRSTRGPKCEGLEKRRDAKLEEAARLQRDKDLTDRASNIEAELYSTKKERDAEGATPDHIDAEMETFTGFLALLHIITPEQGKVLAENKPILEVITMELQAFASRRQPFSGIIWVFGLMTCHRGEADRRMVEIAR